MEWRAIGGLSHDKNQPLRRLVGVAAMVKQIQERRNAAVGKNNTALRAKAVHFRY
jgi:hypothetical protein